CLSVPASGGLTSQLAGFPSRTVGPIGLAHWPRCALRKRPCRSPASAKAIFRRHAAAVHLVFEALHRRATEVPCKAGASSAAAYDFVGEEGGQVMHGVDLGGGRVRPGAAKPRETTLHLGENEDRFLADRPWAGLAVAHGAVAIAGAPFGGLTAARDDETRRGRRGRHREGEGVKRGLGRWIELRTDVAASDGIDLGSRIIDAPTGQRCHIAFVEGAEACIGEGRWRP